MPPSVSYQQSCAFSVTGCRLYDLKYLAIEFHCFHQVSIFRETLKRKKYTVLLELSGGLCLFYRNRCPGFQIHQKRRQTLTEWCKHYSLPLLYYWIYYWKYIKKLQSWRKGKSVIWSNRFSGMRHEDNPRTINPRHQRALCVVLVTFDPWLPYFLACSIQGHSSGRRFPSPRETCSKKISQTHSAFPGGAN